MDAIKKEEFAMTIFEDYLATLEKSEQREKIATLLTWIAQHYPDLTPVIKWKQPMFIEHGTYIIGLSASKHHFSLSPEAKTIRLFEDEIKAADYETTINTIKIKWTQPLDFELFKKMIDYNRTDKKEMTQFWR